MKIIIHLYFNENYTEIKSSEIQISSNEITVKELKKILSEIYEINPSEQILTIKLFGLKIITLSDEYPLSFFYIRKHSEIYLDTVKRYRNRSPSKMSIINSGLDVINPKIKNIEKKIYNKIKSDEIMETIEENEDNEKEGKEEIENNENQSHNNSNYIDNLTLIKEVNSEFIIRTALYMIKDDKFIDFIKYLEINKSVLGCVKQIINKNNNWNALHYSCYYGNKDITAFLLSYNTNSNSIHDLINSLTNENYTPLHIACHQGHVSIVKILLLYLRDIDINIINNNKETPLHIACRKNSIKIVSMLIASNANLFLIDKNNKKPIELTDDNNIKKLLVKSMVKSPSFKNENLNNINLDISLYKESYFTPPKPPITIGVLEKRGQIIPFYKTIFVEVDPILGHFKKFKEYRNFPDNHSSLIMLNTINLCKKENSDSKEDFYFSITSQKTEIYRVKNKSARDKWIKCINESVVYYKYWKKFQKKNQNIEDYIKLQKNSMEMIDYRSGEVKIIGGDELLRKGNGNNKRKKLINLNEDNKNNSNDNIINNNINDNKINNKINNININNINNINNYEINKIKSIKEDNLANNNIINNEIIKKINDIKDEDKKNNNKINEIKEEKKINKISIIKESNKGIKFADYIILGLLGTGSFGRVFKVKLKDDPSSKIYAMKVINKNYMIRKKQMKYAVGECNVLKRCDCPFIVKLYFSFQTLENLYIVEEYCPGGDLQNHLKISLLEEEEAKFYIGEVILAIEHLHNLNIIYRDLKPENILIGEDNHIILADFGLAKEGIEGNLLSRSFCGSPAYLPPESLSLNGRGKSGDIYGIGAVLYEMISGTPPFYANEITVLFNKIKNCQVVLHHYFSEDLKDLMKKLLEKDPDKRFGVFDKDEIKQHPFFKGIDWEKLEKKELNPPINFIKQKNKNDTIFGENKNIKKINFTDVDYNNDNKFSKRVKNFTFIRNDD